MNEIPVQENAYARFRRQLRPYMEMLNHKKSELEFKEWVSFVRLTELKITNSPEQYIQDLPQKDVLNSLIHKLFNDFVEDSVHVNRLP